MTSATPRTEPKRRHNSTYCSACATTLASAPTASGNSTCARSSQTERTRQWSASACTSGGGTCRSYRSPTTAQSSRRRGPGSRLGATGSKSRSNVRAVAHVVAGERPRSARAREPAWREPQASRMRAGEDRHTGVETRGRDCEQRRHRTADPDAGRNDRAIAALPRPRLRRDADVDAPDDRREHAPDAVRPSTSRPVVSPLPRTG